MTITIKVTTVIMTIIKKNIPLANMFKIDNIGSNQSFYLLLYKSFIKTLPSTEMQVNTCTH